MDESSRTLLEVPEAPWVHYRRKPRCCVGIVRHIFKGPCTSFTIHRLLRWAKFFFLAISIITLVTFMFFPSYSSPPGHYLELQRRVAKAGHSSKVQGTANPAREKIFIAASLHDTEGRLVSGAWGKQVLDLIQILGPENVFLSIYENDADAGSQQALEDLRRQLPCQSSIVHEHLDTGRLTHVLGADGKSRLKRIALLAKVRNRALDPLEDPRSPAAHTSFDKLLYINDVYFHPTDIANLLFSTNLDKQSGKTNYRAACGVDFGNPIKFYDTFATRDLDGFEMGTIIFPWFTNAGRGLSRQDVVAQRDAVRVKSCWGGVVAFEARWFQSLDARSGLPSLRFRAEDDTYWDSSECCLIHADLNRLAGAGFDNKDYGIYMNPYIRVAYSTQVLWWLPVARRVERLFTPVHTIINWIAGLPRHNPRRLQAAANNVLDSKWIWDAKSIESLRNGETTTLEGSYQPIRRNLTSGGFCGHTKLSYVNENATKGEPRWQGEMPPAH